MNEIKSFMHYLCGDWCLDEARRIYGREFGDHIFAKWLNRVSDLRWWGELDDERKRMLLDRAFELYPIR